MKVIFSYLVIVEIVVEVAATMKEIVDDIRGDRDGEVVVIVEGDKVNEGGEEQVDYIFVGEIEHELELGTDLHESVIGVLRTFHKKLTPLIRVTI